MEWIFLAPIGTAFLTRVANNWRRVAPFWALASIVTFFIFLSSGYYSDAQMAATAIGVASVAGFLIPSGWEALEAAIRRPRTWLWLAGIGFLVYAYYNPLQAGLALNQWLGALIHIIDKTGLLPFLLTLAIMWFGVRLMLRPFRRRGKKK